MTWRFDYRRWDGTQDSDVNDTDDVLSQLTDDLLANGDMHEALQRMLNRGWRTPDGRRVEGLRDLLEQLRLEREEQLERGDLGGAYQEIAEELRQVVAEERLGIERLEADARASADERRQEVTPRPVCRGALAPQQTGCAEDQRTRTDRSHEPCGCCETAQFTKKNFIAHGVVEDTRSSRDANHVACRDVGKPM